MKNWLVPWLLLSLIMVPGYRTLFADEDESGEPGEDIELDAFNVIEDAERRGYQSNLIIGANRMVVPIDEMATTAFVINSEFIEDLNPRYLTDVSRYVAGVENSRFYDVIDGIVIRSNESGANLTDGFPVPGLSYVPMALVEQVEVIKGPQGVLYGQISAGGFFNRVMKKPQFEPSGEINFQVGTYGFFGGMLDTTGPLGENEEIAYRFITSVREGGGRQDNLQTSRPERVFAGALKFALPGGGNFLLMVDSLDRETTFADQVTFGDPVTGIVNEARHRKHAVYSSLRTWQENLRVASILEKKIGPIDARLSYQYNDHHWADDALFPWGVGVELPIAARFRDNYFENHNFFIDSVWQPKLGGIDNIVNFGFSYDKSDGLEIQIVNFAQDPADYPTHKIDDPPLSIVFNHESPRNTRNRDADTFSSFYSFYGNWRASIADGRLNLIGGARYQNYEKGGADLLPDAAQIPTKDDHLTLFRAGGVFKVAEGVNLWASFGETFNISSALAPTREGDTILFLPDPGAENIEGGVKVALWERKLNLTATYYALTQTGRTRSGSSSLIPIVPVDDSTNKGFELQATAEPVPGLLLIASITDQKVRTADGERDTDTAETIANLWAKYTIPEGPMAGLGAGFGIVHYGDKRPFGIPGTGQFGSDNPLTDYMIPAVTTLDLAISFDRGPWRFGFNGRNITDKIYMNRTSGSFGAHWINNGRTLSWSLSYRW